MSIESIGFTLHIVGEILIAYTVIMVHRRVQKEHKIDERVFAVMKKEQIMAIIGVVFILIGYFLQLPSKI